MTFMEKYWDTSHYSVCFNIQGEDTLEHTNVKCHLCTL